MSNIIQIKGKATAGGFSAAPIKVTTANLGGLEWLFSTAGAIGTTERVYSMNNKPLKSKTIGTQTQIICPAVTGGIWKVNVIMNTGI